mmetsp:Transcript_6660/g.11756  ORF Transcript_6660/g.11756 Transcript_6660/m.11756 type:complete len:764 (+) Transcript_6660:3332-5623(+)
MTQPQKRFAYAAAALLAALITFKAGSTAVLAFFFGVVCTVAVQALLLLKYLSAGNSDSGFYSHQPAPEPQDELPVKLRTMEALEPLPDPDLVCACCTDSFQELLIGTECRLPTVQKFVKDAISMDKAYSQALGKLGEASLLNKLVKKQFMFKGDDGKNSPSWMHVKEQIHSLGNKIEQDSEYLSVAIASNLKAVTKSCSERLKELNLQHKEASEPFISTTHELKEILSKLTQAKKAEVEAERNYDTAKQELEDFSTLVKLEMHLKIARNATSTLNMKLHEVRGRSSTTAASYLPKMQQLHQEFKKMQFMRTDSVKGCLESWASVLEDNLTQSLEIWRSLKSMRNSPSKEEPEESSFTIKGLLAKAIPKLAAENQMDKMEREIKQITVFYEEIKSFISNFAKAEALRANNLKKLASFEIQMEDEGLQEGWEDFSIQLCKLSEVSEKFVGELEVAQGSYTSLEEIINNLNRMRKTEHPNIQELKEYLSQAMTMRDESSEFIKAHILRTYESRLLDAKKAIQGLDRSLDSSRNPKEANDFTPMARDHRTECPCYKFEASEIEVKAEEELKVVGVSESCLWFNDALNTFVQEWSLSAKFQDYACKRLNKVYNKKRPKYLSEIKVRRVDIKEPAPEFKNFTALESDPGDFFYEVEVFFKGQVRIHLSFDIQWTFGSITVNAVVVLRALYGRLRLFFTPCHRGRSFYAFTAEPAFQIALEPIIGKDNKLVLSKYPQLTTFLVSILAKKIRKYVWPNKRSLKIPKSRNST